MEIDGPLGWVDLFRFAMFLGFIVVAFMAGMAYESARHEEEERKWRDGR